ncbi:MAG: SDR family oxidoreductase [Candidatus Pacebacteria bacterium]|jgi:UDP-glucose 4-epimerase|nr:SDR family oxidoreductase [Candidatus Paceibacterota bacterium]MBT4004454.1 SDR family oxidoreductase [Candidatus Paceibacterota bacterium]MBT4358566.1 SDR family oxidoreductase [Candidatus Paceibacterota bacterium]MBT4680506.1 SDR family oxidoreductase [Candidatus Paceibacterota bacterium]MBT6898833.1 SDR family oxidoreductase [Candidatus Paceibacterota bacterium]
MGRLKVLVTGGSGFVGSCLIDTLEKDESLEVIQFKGDLLDIDFVRNFFKENDEIDTVVHLAGLFSSNPDDLLKVNFTATNNLLEGLSALNIRKFIFSSSGVVYGSAFSNKFSESDSLNPTTPYALSKMMAEKSIKSYSQKNGFSHLILRFPNIFGEGQKKGVFHSLLTSIKRDGVATIHGDGEQRRDFLHVDDAVDALHKSIYVDEAKGILNASSEMNLSINEILDIFKKDLDFEVKYVESRDDVFNISLNYQKISAILNLENNRSNRDSISGIAENFD